jgi:putative membrane protein
MAYAYGFGAFGFGLGFLNFLGTVLFFILLIIALKFMFRGFRYAGPPRFRGHWTRGEHHHGKYADGAWDEAMETARDRVAKGDITAEEFQTVKQGLQEDGAGERGWFGRGNRALEIARMRLASGEITLEDFQAVKKTLAS